MKVIVSGGCGYIGSHVCVELSALGYDVLVIDNLSNSSESTLDNIKRISGSSVKFNKVDIRDLELLKQIFIDMKPDAVLHFAGLKSVSESVRKPVEYFDVNVMGAINILEAMDLVGCEKIVFSSSATVYGNAQYLPLDEKHPVSPSNPYGNTKLMFERILRIWADKNSNRRAVCLRYLTQRGHIHLLYWGKTQ